MQGPVLREVHAHRLTLRHGVRRAITGHASARRADAWDGAADGKRREVRKIPRRGLARRAFAIAATRAREVFQ
jgi:hypothetical protein